jgi:hypothetical protein
MEINQAAFLLSVVSTARQLDVSSDKVALFLPLVFQDTGSVLVMIIFRMYSRSTRFECRL